MVTFSKDNAFIETAHRERIVLLTYFFPSAAIAGKYKTKPQSGRKVKGFRLVLDHTDRDSEECADRGVARDFIGLIRFDSVIQSTFKITCRMLCTSYYDGQKKVIDAILIYHIS